MTLRDPEEQPLEHFNIMMLRPGINDAIYSWRDSSFTARHLSNNDTRYSTSFIAHPLAAVRDMGMIESKDFGGSNANRYEVSSDVTEEDWERLDEITENVFQARIMKELERLDRPLSAVEGLEKDTYYSNGELQVLRDDYNDATLNLYDGLTLIDLDKNRQVTADLEDIEYVRQFGSGLREAAESLEKDHEFEWPEDLNEKKEEVYSYFDLGGKHFDRSTW